MTLAERRVVRVGTAFFDQLDQQLPTSRGPQESRATDVLVLDLPPVVERFATGFDHLPAIVEGLPAARTLIAQSRLVRAFAVYGLLMPDDSIELSGVEIDSGP